jgi:hypothetical protein
VSPVGFALQVLFLADIDLPLRLDADDVTEELWWCVGILFG